MHRDVADDGRQFVDVRAWLNLRRIDGRIELGEHVGTEGAGFGDFLTGLDQADPEILGLLNNREGGAFVAVGPADYASALALIDHVNADEQDR